MTNRKQISLIIFLFCAQLTYGQSALGLLDLYNDASLSLQAKTFTQKANIGDYAFHSKGNSISFQATANPAENLKGKSISLDYTGGQFVITIGAQSYYPELPDWQLIPIANFANSPYSVAFTVMEDTTIQCKYHRAFLDNLLGLRLFQASLLKKPDVMWTVPVDARQNYLLAQSEIGFRPYLDTLIYQTLYDDLTGDKKKFTSYVLTDKDVDIRFDADRNGFKLSGNPYYYFTITEFDTENIDNTRKQLESCYAEIDKYSKLLLKDKYSPQLNSKNNLKGLLKVLDENKEQEASNAYSSNVENALKKLDSLTRLSDNEIGIKFKVLNNYTNTFNKNNWILLENYNPLIYNAVEKTAQWAAFFRYVIKANPNNWARFIDKVKNLEIKDAPSVKTPTSYEINYFRIFDEFNQPKKR
jgi:hypothetical protein